MTYPPYPLTWPDGHPRHPARISYDTPLDASLRHQMHGPIQPMEEPSLLRRLLSFGRG